MISCKNNSVKLLLLTFFILLAGCARMGQSVEEPQVTLVDMQLLEVKPLEAVFQISLRVMNPNDFSLDLKGVSCKLNIDGTHFATGIGDKYQEIPAFGTDIVPLTVYVSTLKMFSSVLALVQDMDGTQDAMQPIHYELAGKIRLGGAIGMSVPFTSKGELSLAGQQSEAPYTHYRNLQAE
jgi:LEA14-like dessication related protein